MFEHNTCGRKGREGGCILPTNKRSRVDVVNGPTGPIIYLSSVCHQPSLSLPPWRLLHPPPFFCIWSPFSIQREWKCHRRGKIGMEEGATQQTPDQNSVVSGRDYRSRSVFLHVPWGTRICSLPRAVPGTGKTDGTWWGCTGRGRRHTLDLDVDTKMSEGNHQGNMQQAPTYSTTDSFVFHLKRGEDRKRREKRVYEDFLCNRGHFLIGFRNITRPD